MPSISDACEQLGKTFIYMTCKSFNLLVDEHEDHKCFGGNLVLFYFRRVEGFKVDKGKRSSLLQNYRNQLLKSLKYLKVRPVKNVCLELRSNA
jgi:hypothetical protein